MSMQSHSQSFTRATIFVNGTFHEVEIEEGSVINSDLFDTSGSPQFMVTRTDGSQYPLDLSNRMSRGFSGGGGAGGSMGFGGGSGTITNAQTYTTPEYTYANPTFVPIDANQFKNSDDENDDGENMAREKIVTMRDARGKHYEIFAGPDNAARGQKEGILKYIELLGTQTGTDVSEWEIAKFFKNKKIIIDKGEINKIFFKEKSKISMFSAVKKPKYVKAEILKDLSRRVNIDYAIQIANAKLSVQTAAAQKAHQERGVLNIQREIEKRQKIVEELTEKANTTTLQDYKLQIKALLKTGKIELAENQPIGGIRFITTPINKSLFHSGQARNMFVPLGQFFITVTNTDGSWRAAIDPAKNNINVRNYYHPHVSGQGLCMGSAHVMREEAQKKGNFFDYVMSHYNTLADFDDQGSPYIALYEFENEYKRLLKLKEKKSGTKK